MYLKSRIKVLLMEELRGNKILFMLFMHFIHIHAFIAVESYARNAHSSLTDILV
jgi:hypothetical protein